MGNSNPSASKSNSVSNPDHSKKNSLASEKQKYLQKMFGQPCYSTNEQYIRLVTMLGKNPKLPPQTQAQTFLVFDQMTMSQLVEKWHKNSKKAKELKQAPQKFILMYETEFPLHELETVMDLKARLGKEILPKNTTLRVYQKQHCPFFQNESAMTEQNYLKYENTMKNSIDIPVKILMDGKRAEYFNIEKANPNITILQLRKIIEETLKSGSLNVKCHSPIGYTLWVSKKQLSPFLNKRLEQKKIKVQEILKNCRITLEKELPIYTLRQVCSPGDIINISFTTDCFTYEAPPAIHDCSIKITCYKKDSLEKKIIVRNFSEISKMRISTLLKEQDVQDALLMSIYLNGVIFKPMIKFQDISLLENYIKNQKSADFVCIPDNFLYYQELAKLTNPKTMFELLNEIPQKKLGVQINQNTRETYRQLSKQRLEKLKQQARLREQHKEVDFLDPIMVYTSNMIYEQLNKFLRQTSPALFSKDEIQIDYWHYSVSQKLVKNLLKLDNYRGTVYRGSGGYEYCYEVGQIVEWNFFTSTSKLKSAAEEFVIGKSHRYIFEIRTFSGKQIGMFSMLEDQAEVLILPYTKFRLQSIEIGQYYTHVKLVQIPMPKKIPGHVIVWVDNNLQQNALYFNMFVKDCGLNNFDLIQLQSNEQFILWLNEFKYILEMPYVKVHFITNMNRSPKINGQSSREGIKTLQIIRSFNKKAKVIFFIENIPEKLNDLKNAGKDQDPYITVIDQPQHLMEIFIQEYQKFKAESPKEMNP